MRHCFFDNGNVNSMPLYNVWCIMKQRCNNPKQKSFSRYGGRGIKVCDEWVNSFISFHTWAMSNGYKKGLQLDRKNNDGNYTPENCQFVTLIDNCQNTSACIKITHNNKTLSVNGWARELNTTRYRIKKLFNITRL